MKPLFPLPRIWPNRLHRGIGLFILAATVASGQEVVLHFDQEIVGKPVPAYTNNGVVFTAAHAPTRSSAVARVMFFPHLKTDRKGILNAMADDPIPVKVQFPAGACSVTLVLWGSTGCPARLEAFNNSGNLVDAAAVTAAPARTSPADPVPSFELTVKAPEIAYVCFRGPREGEFLAAEEVRYKPRNGSSARAPATQ
jgi:hypothetical protein